jgi:hypothetical protein
MIRRKWLTIVMRGEQHVIAPEIGQGHIGRKALLGVNQDVIRGRLQADKL